MPAWWKSYDFPLIPALLTAVTSQQALGDDFILRGYLTQDWISALLLYTRDKPDQKLKHIYLGIWTILFEAIWETRNTIKHGGNTIVHAHEREALLSDISEWRRNRYNCLSNGQQYLLDYPHEETQQWTNSSLKHLLELLQQASTNYQNSLLPGAQKLITSYFQPIPRDDETE